MDLDGLKAWVGRRTSADDMASLPPFAALSATLDRSDPDPRPGEGDVIVAVKASSLNYHDVFTRRGMPGIKVPMPAIMGLDVAGEIAEVADPRLHHGSDQVFFGATVTYLNSAGSEHTVTIVGIDELDPLHGKISWVSPVARALTKAREGDVVTLHTPSGGDELEILSVEYPAPA